MGFKATKTAPDCIVAMVKTAPDCIVAMVFKAAVH
jgi:hypothetical protein